MSNKLKVKRGTNLSNITTAPEAGELIYKSNTNELFVGDGSTPATGLTAIGGTGTVDTSGTPIAQEYARFTDANTIEGRSAAGVRTDLGLVIGTNVQAQDTLLQDIADFDPDLVANDGKVIALNSASGILELVPPGTSFNGSTANGLLTYGNSTTADVESNLTFSSLTLQIPSASGKVSVDKIEGYSNNTNSLFLNDDQTLTINQVSLQSINHINIMTDGNNNGTGNFKVWNGSYDVDTADLAFQVNSNSNAIFYGDVTLSGTGDLKVPGTIEHVGDSDTYIFLTNDRIRLYAGGELLLDLFEGTQDYVKLGDGGDVDINLNDDMFIQGSSSNVGIGTTSPSHEMVLRKDQAAETELSIVNLTSNSSATTNLRFRNATSGSESGNGALIQLTNGNDFKILNQFGNNLIFGTSNAEKVRLASNGNLIVGSDYTTNASTKLVVSHSGANGILLNNDASNTANSGRLFFEGTSTSAIFQEGNDLSFRTGATTGSSSGTERMLINSSGTVYIPSSIRANNLGLGIGDASPQNTLHVDATTSSNVVARFNTDSTFTFIDLYNDDANRVQIGNADDGDFIIRTNDAERFRVDKTTGNVGIGVTGGTYKLQIPITQKIGYYGDSTHLAYWEPYSGATGHMTLSNTWGGGNAHILLMPDTNVGIGTTSPSDKLDVNGGITTNYGVAFTNGNTNFLQYNNSGEDVLYLRDTTNGAMLMTYGTTRTTIHKNTRHSDQVEFEDTNAVINRVSGDLEIRTYAGYDINLMPAGNVGIGTQSPGAALEIKDYFQIEASSSYMGILGFNRNVNTGAILNGSYGAYQLHNYQGKLQLQVYNSSGTAVDQNALVVDNSGNVGIGVVPKTGGSTWQHIQFGGTGNLIARKSDTTIDSMFANNYYVNSSNVDSYITTGAAARMFFNDNVITFDQAASGSTDASISFSTAMKIDSSGNVLIGGTSASGHGFNLEVLNDHAYVKGPDGWNGTGDKAIVALGSAVSNESFGCGYVYGTGLVLSTYKLSGGGDFGSSTQNSLEIADTTGVASFINDVVAFATSDKRLKENVKPLDNALDKINKINGVEFDWIDGKDEHGNSVHGNEGHDVGVIAQEIEEILPEVVTTRDNGYKAVKYEKIVPLLIEAIKEQQQRINKLEEKLNG